QSEEGGGGGSAGAAASLPYFRCLKGLASCKGLVCSYLALEVLCVFPYFSLHRPSSKSKRLTKQREKTSSVSSYCVHGYECVSVLDSSLSIKTRASLTQREGFILFRGRFAAEEHMKKMVGILRL
ncbi:unnamed protein product, partial [Ectocarpus sp. 12 AP-2014]